MSVAWLRFCSVVLAITISAPCLAIDWDKQASKDIVLFYPGQLSWETLLTQSQHSGADKFRDGKNCRQCHEGEEAASGKLLVADKTSETQPIAGKPGSVKANVKVGIDGDNLLVRVSFDPGQQPNAGMEPKFANKIALMIDDGKVAEVARGGCYAMCHDNLQGMPSANAGDQTTKYLARSRLKMSRKGGEGLKPADQLAQYQAEGAVMEYWQARLTPGQPPDVVDGIVLDQRKENSKPIVTATANEANGAWVVIFSRKLVAGAPYKDLAPGKIYTLGFALHAGHTAHRFHYVSLEKTLAINQGTADFVAVRN